MSALYDRGIFIEAWMRCVNTIACRRLVLKHLDIMAVHISYDTKSFRKRLTRAIRDGKRILVVKQFDNEVCHWLYMRRQGHEVHVYDTNRTHYDMSDVLVAVPDSVRLRQMKCHVQTSDDPFCQTWSIVYALCDSGGNHAICDHRQRLRWLIREVWGCLRFRQWMQHEVAIVRRELKKGYIVLSTHLKKKQSYSKHGTTSTLAFFDSCVRSVLETSETRSGAR